MSERWDELGTLASAEVAGLLGQELVDELLRSADRLQELEESPLLSAIRETVTEVPESGVLAIIPFARHTSLASVRASLIAVALESAEVSFDHVQTLRDARHSLDELTDVIYLGSPRGFGDSVITAPLADTSHFLFYDFFQVDSENSYGNEFSQFSPIDLGEPHRMVFHEIRHGPYLGEDIELEKDSETHKVIDREEFQINPLRDLADRIRSQDEEDLKRATAILLGQDLWAAFSGKLRVLRLEEEWRQMVIDALDLSPDDLLVVEVSVPSNLAADTVAAVMRSSGRGLETWKKVQSWYKSRIAEVGLQRVKRECEDGGLMKFYEYWFEDERLGPGDNETFEILLGLAGVSVEESAEAIRATENWHSARTQAGRQLAERFYRRAFEQVRNFAGPNAGIGKECNPFWPVVAPGETDAIYGICEVVGIMGEEDIPASRCGRLLDSRGNLWRG